MFKCTSGKHVWFKREDADKCCNPQYRRELVIGGGTHQQLCAGVSIGRQWVCVKCGKPNCNKHGLLRKVN